MSDVKGFLQRLEAIRNAKREEASLIPQTFVARFEELAEHAYKIDSPAAAIAHVENIFIEANELYDRYPQRADAVFAVVAPAMLACGDMLFALMSHMQNLPYDQRMAVEGIIKQLKEARIPENRRGIPIG